MEKSGLRDLKTYIVTFSIVLVFAVAALLQVNASPMSATTHVVTVGGDLPHVGGEGMYMGYNPFVIVIKAGDTVVWKALDGPHTVTSANVAADGKRLFDSQPKVPFPLPEFLFGPGGLIPPGGTYTLNTSTLSPGTYDIICTLHVDEQMKATLTVTNDSAPPGSQFNVVTGYGSVTNDMDQFVPSNITVAHGTKVNFVNLSSIEVHTVASLVTFPNGTKAVGTLFDSSPIFTPPGTSFEDLPKVNLAGVQQLGGAMFPIPGMDTFSYTFNAPGTYVYFCKFHSQVENGNVAGMVGEVVVLPAYGTSSDIADLNAQVAGQIATVTVLAVVGIILGVTGIGLAVWARQRKSQ